MQFFWEIVASNALMVVVLAAGVALLGRVWKNPVALHLLWMLVLLKLVTPPMLTVPVPLPTTPVPPATEAASRVGTAHQTTTTANIPNAVGDAHPTLLAHQRFPDDRAVSKSPPPDLGTAVVTQSQKMPWQTVLGWMWGIGIVLFASGHAYRILRFRKLLHYSEAPAAALLGMAEGIAKRLGLRQVPPIRLLPVCVSPMVWSLGGRPSVYLPAVLFERLDEPAREAILAHELAHVRRKDHWVRLLEVVVTTLFWWHPVVWWACRELRELEEQCCDCVVVDIAPHSAKNYATALLDTLDFLSERAIPAPLGATAAKSSISLTRRITMLKNRSWTVRWTFGRLVLLLTVAALPMALAFGQKAPEATEKMPQSVVERRAINKLVKDFPQKVDLSTPESAFVAYERAWARRDAKAVCELGWYVFNQREVEDTQRFMDRDASNDAAAYCNISLNTEVVEVATYRGDLADVISKLKLPEGIGRDPYSSRSFGKINGVWKNLGEDRLPSLEAARENFDRKKESLWKNFMKIRESIKSGKPVSAHERPKNSAPIAPGQPLGISVEKADLMGRVEWALMHVAEFHGGKDITARKTIEWSDVEKDANGNRKIRYKFEATIWDKDVYIVNKVFTFDPKGNILDIEDVEGFPQKKVVKPVDVNTQAGMKELVEDFFSKNFRDITSRKTIEWGKVVKAENGDSSIRYKYRATIWDKDTKVMNQIFTFDPKGKFVSFKNVE